MFHRNIGRTSFADRSKPALRCFAVLVALAAVEYSMPFALACSVCQCGDPLAPAGQTKLSPGQFQMGLEYQVLTARARSDDDPTFIESLTQMTLRPVFAFSPWDNFSAVVQVPVTSKNWSIAEPGFDPTRARPTGLGDVDLGARLFLLNRTRLSRRSRESLALSAGTTLPTGANAAQANGFRIDEHAQLGIGALAPYAGILYASSKDPWSFFGSVSGKLPLRNDYAYRYGEALLWSARGEYQ